MASTFTWSIRFYVQRFTSRTSLHKTRAFTFSPNIVDCFLSYKWNITLHRLPASNADKISAVAVYETSLECYSMSDTCNLNYNFKTVKKKDNNPPPGYHTLLYTEKHCVIQHTKHRNIIKSVADTKTELKHLKSTVTHRYTVQYIAYVLHLFL